MWDKIVSELRNYPSAVLSWTDETGYPYSIRCSPQVDQARQVLRIEHSGQLALQKGNASLLCHSHDEHLWDLNSFNARGILEQDESGWYFRPLVYIPGASTKPMKILPFLMNCRKTAKQYLQKRGLKRPQVEWDALKRLLPR